LFDRLAEHFGYAQIFKDVDSIELGDDFVQMITRAVGSCDVLLALIGDQWLTAKDEDGAASSRRPDDFAEDLPRAGSLGGVRSCTGVVVADARRVDVPRRFIKGSTCANAGFSDRRFGDISEVGEIPQPHGPVSAGGD
jgi:hypothetical protein